MYRGAPSVVFDLDGTLADTSADLLAAANACFSMMGHEGPLDPADALTAFHGGRAMLSLGFARLRLGVGEEDITHWYGCLLDAYAASISTHTRLYPGAAEALGILRDRGYRLAICTNKPENLAEQLLCELGVRDLFDSLVGADTLASSKPDPTPYRLAVEQAGSTVGQSLFVGDTETDYKTARAVPVPLVMVSFGPEGHAVRRFEPDALLDHFADLPLLADRILGI